MTETVLVTGGAGFIGSHLCQALVQKNYHVRVLDNLSFGNKAWLPEACELIEGDIKDLTTCHLAMQGISGVFHCAAMARAAPSLQAIQSCTDDNIVGTQNVLIAARDAGIKKLIYSGSSTYYGSQATPHHEYNTPAQFLNFYALTKQVGEQYCLMFDKVFNVPCVILRYFNVYGPRQPREGAYALVVGIFLERIKAQQPLIIHGDGSQRRDFIHVYDVVAANIAAYESSVRGETFNVGSGQSLSIKEVASMLTTEHIHQARREGDAEITLADISRITAALNWQPQISFQQGLQELLAEL